MKGRKGLKMWISFAVNNNAGAVSQEAFSATLFSDSLIMWVRKVREDELYRRRNIAGLFVVEVNIWM